jgi:hypothetical protein
MLKQIFTIAAIFFSYNLLASTTSIELKPGSVLVYSVTDGKKVYKYTVTLKTWDDDSRSFAWKTDEKPTANAGTVILAKYYTLSSYKLNIGIGKKGINEIDDEQTFLIAPVKLQDYLLGDEDYSEFTIIENGKEIEQDIANYIYDEYLESDLLYNGKNVKINYAHLTPKKSEPEIGFTLINNQYYYILSYYKSKDVTMKLVSVKTPTTKAVPVVATKPVTNQQLKMTDAKLKDVKKVFPILAKLEEYDVTNKGAEPKPFDETYDFRIANKSSVPPSAIDCFTADLQIIYNQKDKFDMADISTAISKNNFPAGIVKRVLEVYKKKKASSIPGYKPWTHWKFVKSLTDAQFSQIATEIEGYIKKYGLTQ